jgi:hypothetical protein
LESGGRFCVVVFGRNAASVTVIIFSSLIYLETRYKFHTFSAICKGNAAVNCVTLQHRKGFLPST